MHRFILAILWVPIYAIGSTVVSQGPETAGDDNATCKAPECTEMAKMIKKQMGGKEPCDDFYNYVCGNWSGDRELKPRSMKRKAIETLIGLLENATEPTSEAANATNKFVLAYKSCTKKGNDTEALRTSIKKVMARYNLTKKEWPLIEKKPPSKRKITYENILKKTGPRPLFSYSVSRSDRPVILMTKPSDFYVGDFASFDIVSRSDSDQVTTEPDYPEDYNELFDRDEKAYKTFITKTILLLNNSVRQEMADRVAENIIEMEKGLQKLASEANVTDEIKMSLSQLSQNLSAFPMTKILRKDFEGLNITINNRTEVLVKYIDYYQNAAHFIECSNTTTLINYILWTYIRNMAKAEGTKLHKIYLEYKRNTSIYNLTDVPSTFDEDGITGISNLSLLCVRQLLQTDIMYAAGASYYIRAKFNKASKDDVLEIMKFVEERFRYFVTNNTWMTDTTKAAAIEKLNQTKHIIGYPDWMLNDTIMNALYEFVPFIAGNASFVEHYYFLSENEHKQGLLQLNTTAYFKKTDEDTPLRSHAYYDGTTNTSVYPAAALVTHYRSPPIPRSINYGTIGTILAQLLTAIIERYDGLSKETGRYNKDNWDNQTAESFCNRSSCLNTTVECNDTHASPSRHKFEKFHDYVGVRVSYQAMVKSKDNYTMPNLLPDDMNRFDSESKIFFISFGSLYCPFSVNEKQVEENQIEEKTVEARSDDSDDEAKFPNSLNEIVYTYNKFNTTFNCTLTAEADTCDLMPKKEVAPPIGC